MSNVSFEFKCIFSGRTATLTARPFEKVESLMALTAKPPSRQLELPLKTRTGKAMRAVSFNLDAAKLMAKQAGIVSAVVNLATEKLSVTYAVPLREEEVTIGNPGFRQYRYRVTWKGDTVVRMTPLSESAKTGFSDFDGKQVPVFYGTDGPGPLYQREYVLEESEPKPTLLHVDDGSLDFWFLR